jgi:hypothetical protein
VNLCDGAMAQPGGRICGFPRRYRTYLRCSPLICGADLLAIVMRLSTSMLYMRFSVRQSVGLLFHDRYNSDHSNGRLPVTSQTENEDDLEERFQTLERTTWLRWLWVVLATLSPTIKLLAMSGVIWPHILGMIFFASWIVSEALIVFAAVNQRYYTVSTSGEISWPGYDATRQSEKWQQAELYLDYWQSRLGIAALTAHIALVVYAVSVSFDVGTWFHTTRQRNQEVLHCWEISLSLR